MKLAKFLNIKGALLDNMQLQHYLEKIASEHTLQKSSSQSTYPIPRLDDNFKQITKTYDLLNSNLKLGINIHPAGEWLLDNYYIIEETYKSIKKELTLKKYQKFVGISNGEYKGFARIYVLATEIVAYTDGKIDSKKLKELLKAYQNRKTLNMEEIWNISSFLNIALIEQIRGVCEKIYFVQLQKYKVESIIERLVENKKSEDLIFRKNVENNKLFFSKEPFIEYLSYRLNQYGKKGQPYLQVLEEQVIKTGTSISEIIKKEHFDIALKKLSIGNCIKSIKDIQRIDFTKIFEQINGVEDILKNDPAGIYESMTYKTKEYYRNTIKEISTENHVAEIYLTTKALELANKNKDAIDKRKSHIGYYIIGDGLRELSKELNIKIKKDKNPQKYIGKIQLVVSLIMLCISFLFFKVTNNIIYTILFLVFSYVPISEVIIKFTQYILSKIVKPKLIPKLDFSDGIPENCATMVIVPTILKSKKDVSDMLEKLEVYYLANKSNNIYFTLLGDCSTSSKEVEEYDEEVIENGKKIIEKLNAKYSKSTDIFNFIYRKRLWNSKENNFLGWERKRGLIEEFNGYLLGEKNNSFKYNSFDNKEIPKIKYVITLDSDTKLVLDTAKELVGAMAHILNKPVIDKEKNIVVDGYGIMQPRIGIDIDSSRKSLFTKIFAGMGGTDAYSNAISDIYQDNFDEGIFTGKGIYDLDVFYNVLENAIPENTVLSHDLLEGIYAKCGLVTDIVLLDSYPTKFNSYMLRASRWIRGDWQIILWLKNKVRNAKGDLIDNPINELGKYKILDNLRRSTLEIFQVLSLFILLLVNNSKMIWFYSIIFLSIFIDLFLDFLNTIIFKKEGIKKQASFENKLPGLKLSFVRTIINFSCIVYKAFVALKAILVTLKRLIKTKEHLLEWTTADEAEKSSKVDLYSYIKEMWINELFGIILLIISMNKNSIYMAAIAILWIFSAYICYRISKNIEEIEKVKLLSLKEKKEVIEIAQKTWNYFYDFINKENNYLPPDNYQESRKEKIVDRTSSTNIGLGLISVVSAYDLKFIELETALFLIQKMLETIYKLPKWNGHLYNWYNIKTLRPLIPEYVSTVDSGNFIGYLITLKYFLEEIEDKELRSKYLIDDNLKLLDELIEKTDFSKLYDNDIGLFSIGFNVGENTITDSYYDLLATEARQASIIAIAKKDIPSKHWNNLSRTLTSMDGKKGLVSWSGTAFEYFMPNINIKKYKGSLLEESCKFAIMSQKKYANKLGIPWGISEAAFNLKDLNSNYQYKAFGIPWLGLKRGLADDIVVSSYGSILAIGDEPKDVIQNIKLLKKYQMYNKYGFYESIDFTPERLGKNKKYEVVKTYMAHHQALILLSINNLINNNILQKRFHTSPQIKAIDILLQEKMPEDVIITKERKEKVQKIKYIGTDAYYVKELNRFNNDLPDSNVISNENYTIVTNKDGSGFSKYKDILINRYKNTNSYKEGIFVYFKNIKNKKIWTSYLEDENSNYSIKYTPDMNETTTRYNNIKSRIKTIVAPNDNVEIRNIKINNLSNYDEILEISTVLEPVLSTAEQDYAHKAFNNLFLKYEKIADGILIKRNKRGINKEIFLCVGFFSNNGNVRNLEYEINKEKLYGRLNLGIPKKIEESERFSNNIGLVVDPIIAFRRTIKVEANSQQELNLVISVAEDKQLAIDNLDKYKSFENVKRIFEISKIRNEETSRYLQINGKSMILYQKVLSYILNLNPLKKLYLQKLNISEFRHENLWEYGISGDKPIILVKIKDINNVYVIRELLKMYLYFENKNIEINLVILNEEKNVYEKYVKDAIEKEITDMNLTYLMNNKIFLLEANKVKNKEVLFLKANLIIDAKKGSLENIMLEQEEEYLLKYNVKAKKNLEEEKQFEKYAIEEMNLKFKNSYGGFSEDGREYVIVDSVTTPSAWCNILANEEFGTIVTQNLGGFSWYKNSRLNRITKWSNDTIIDTPSESIYVQDVDMGKYWRIGNGNHITTYGFGYSKYEQNKLDLKQQLDIFVSINDNIKINLLKLKNNTNNIKKINLLYILDLVLDEDEIKSNGNIVLNFNKEENLIYAKNLYNSGIKNICYVYSSEKINSYTGNVSSVNYACDKDLNFENSLGNKPCIAIKMEIEIKAFEEKEISFVVGAEDKEEDFKLNYKDIEVCKNEYINVKNYWSTLLEKVRVKTPSDATNIMLNGWAMYQTIASRLYARSGFNQSGGAFGYRDQLQDSIGVKFLNIEMVKKQILKHAAHQFIDGDVEHWWHEETSRGIRTKFSDDRLWLVYLCLQYIEFCGDKGILDVKIPYIEGNKLKEGQDEDYDVHLRSQIEESLYKHCLRAIDVSIGLGKNSLPLIGSGDWNDGFSTVGNKGKGESVWLGFFLYNILEEFTKIMQEKQEDNELIDKYINIKNQIKNALNSNGWDNDWYRRAFMDNGKILGSKENEECKIDSIAQSWSVISEAGDEDKQYKAMESLEKYLIDENTEIIKLLTPPFETSDLEPGYIKAYLPGVRENGGQYTHAAVWTIIAFAKLNLEEKAHKYFNMINPIEHSLSKEKSEKYKIEPYVIPADIYGSESLLRKRWMELVYGFFKLVL